MQAGVVRLAESQKFGEEDFVLDDVEVYGKQAGVQCRAKRVAVHQADLGIDRLVAEQVLLGRDHVLEDFLVGNHHLGHRFALDLAQHLRTEF